MFKILYYEMKEIKAIYVIKIWNIYKLCIKTFYKPILITINAQIYNNSNLII